MTTATIHERITRAAKTWHLLAIAERADLTIAMSQQTGMRSAWLWQRIDEESRTVTNTASDNPARKY